MIRLLSENPLAFISLAVALVMALSIHEAAHAYVAKRLGDDTADDLGRITLNPLAHLDPIGTLALLFVGFGWGKPVPVNPNNFKNPIADNIKVALAGPASNLALAVLFALFGYIFQPESGSVAAIFTQTIIWYNLVLMFFNLIPIPPLDGSKVLQMFVSYETYMLIEQYGTFVLFGLIALSWFGFPILSIIIFTPTQALFQLLTGFTAPPLF